MSGRVIIESPFKGSTERLTERNVRFLAACLRDCLLRGEAPFASHAIYTLPGVLDDSLPAERKLGINAGFQWRPASERTVVYQDFGISEGMRQGIEHAKTLGHVIEVRSLWKAGQP
jgi:hypothetical protein